MKKTLLFALPALLMCACAPYGRPLPNQAPSPARTQYGEVQGFETDQAKIWLGVPYAAPPVGDLRFRRNQPPKAWKGVLECLKFSSKPVQYMKMFGLDRTSVPASEDCLYLNIWAPKTALSASKLPVFVWIYGGAYHMGEGSDPMYDGTSFARNGVIFVNFNYRVGPLGFYDFSMYDKRFDSNCGISDQIAALKWVKSNIAAFGGDPDNITIAGESAGGTGVYAMLASPAARGLFQKAIAQSGVAGNIESRRTVDLNNALFFEKLGLDPTKDIQKLLTMPAKDMLKAAEFTMKEGPKRYPGMFMPGPVKDDLLPMHPWEAMAKGSANGVSVIFGVNHDEGSLFSLMGLLPTNWDQVKKMLQENGATDHLPAVTELYRDKTGQDKLEALAGDLAFVISMIKSADAQSGHGNVYVYRFDYVPLLADLLSLGAAHSTEITAALGTNEHPFWWLTPVSLRHEITKSVHEAWINFARTGNPNSPSLKPAWPLYDASKRATFIFDRENHVEDNPAAAVYDVWKDVKLYE